MWADVMYVGLHLRTIWNTDGVCGSASFNERAAVHQDKARQRYTEWAAQHNTLPVGNAQ